MHARWTRIVTLHRLTLLAVLVALPAQVTAGADTLPEKWFFSQRPAKLKGLEGKPTPELKLGEWIGEKVDFTRTKGKVVVIDFWATWCGPCRAAIPKNIEIVNKYKDKGLVFVGVHDANSGWDKADSMVKDTKINYPVVKDGTGGASAKAFNLAFWPTYVVVDRHGVVRGAGLNPAHLEEAVKILIAESGPAAMTAEGESAPKLPSEWFYAGGTRLESYNTIEGQDMPPLVTQNWAGNPLKPQELNDRVVVLHFFASGNEVSLMQAKELARLEKELGPQGVVVIGIAAGDDDWDAVVAGAKELPTRLCRDSELKEDEQIKLGMSGATAAAYGVRFMPCTVIVDATGKIRATGIRIDKVREIAGKLLAEDTGADASSE